MQNSVKYALVACVAVLIGGAGAFWWLVLRDDAPQRASLPSRTETTAPATDPALATTTSPDGSWVVVPGPDVFAGYRIQEIFGGETIKKTAVGRSPAVAGTMAIAGGQVTAVDLQVDMTQLKSDSSRRDSFMQGSGLEIERFGRASFRLTQPIALALPAEAGTPQTVTAVGDLTLHGVTRPAQLTLEARWDGATISVAGGTTVVLSDFQISPPDMPFVKVDGTGELEVQLVFGRA